MNKGDWKERELDRYGRTQEDSTPFLYIIGCAAALIVLVYVKLEDHKQPIMTGPQRTSIRGQYPV